MNALVLIMRHSAEYRRYEATARVFVLQQMFLDLEFEVHVAWSRKLQEINLCLRENSL